ncbi:MAG: universal stress protein [Planctomycetota bacterium]
MADSHDFDREVDDSMRLFERSHIGSAVPLTPVRASRILVVLDGSGQDDATVATAQAFRDEFNTESLFLDAREQSSEPDYAKKAAAKVSGSRGIDRPDGEAFEAILAALDCHRMDLVIVPCPFGRAFETVGEDSVGTVMDVLLARCRVPILVTRRADQVFLTARQRVSVLIGSECDVENRAAAWAFGLAGPGAEVSLNLVVENEHFENIRAILDAMRPDEPLSQAKLTEVLIQTHQTLHGAMSKTAESLSMRYHLLPQAGAIAPPNPLNDPEIQLLVMPIEVDDRFTQGFVHDRLRRSPHPVLIVPGHVPTS